MKLKPGDSVTVKQGVKEPDFEKFELAGWQGRVTEIDPFSNSDHILVTIEWDSETLKQIPKWYIEQSEADGFDWETMVLFETEVEKTEARDKKSDIKNAQKKLENEFYWLNTGEEGKRIEKILRGVNPENEMECLIRWSEYLEDNLNFPIAAVVGETDDFGPVRDGDMVSVKSLPQVADMYGIIAEVRLGRSKYFIPLCELEVIDKSSPDYQLIDDYRVWFANR